MENLVVLYGGDLTRHAFEKYFGNESAFERVLKWGASFSQKIVLLAKNSSESEIEEFCKNSKIGSKIEIVSKDSWSKSSLISQISESLKKNNCKNAIFSYADTPFLNEKITGELLEMHEKYAAEYSFADGFPYGLSPEIIEGGTASILSELARTSLKSEGEKKVDREAIFSVMRGDINSFEIETLISDEDYRLFRFNFESSTKINALSCKNLYDEALSQNVDLADAYALSNLAAKTPCVMQTVPAFYNIQISSKQNHDYCYSLSSINKNPAPKDFMDFADFKKIISQIKDFSENAVISLSAFGEPLLHPDFLEFAGEVLSNNLSLLIETDGLSVTEDMSKKISQKIASLVSEKNIPEINWIVCLDAVDSEMYAKIHGCPETDFEKALLSVQILEKDFPHHVYPQFMRMKTNENQLESFYRFWNEKSSPSEGGLIIQKYNSICGLLPDLKSADLSPVERLPCWHLRRDMTILADGSVPFCFQRLSEPFAGNILSDKISKVHCKIGDFFKNHLHFVNGNPEFVDNICGICDESYTFNF